MRKWMLTIASAAVTMAGLWTPAAAQDAEPPAAGAPEAEELPKAERLFRDGKEALLTGEYEKAAGLLEQAVAEDDGKTSYRVYLARAYTYAGQDDKAEAQLRAVLKTTPDHVEAGQMLARLHAEREKWKEVREVLEPLLKYRHDYLTYHLLAEACRNLDDNRKAREYYEKAVELNPESAVDHYELANIYLAGNFFALASRSYERALELGADSPALRYKLGSAYFNLRNYFGRIRRVEVTGGKPGTISDKWFLIEPVPGEKDTFRAAPSDSAIYQIALAMDEGLGDRPDIRFLRANIYLNARRYAEAYEMLGKLEEAIPDEDRALYRFYHAQAAFGIGKYEEYLALLEKAIELDPAAYEASRVEAYLRVADQHNQQGELDKYITYLEKAMAERPESAALHLKLGDAYAEQRKTDKAVRQWQIVLDLEPDHPQRMDLLNRIARHR